MVRLRRALWLALSMLSLSLLLVALGIYTTTLTETVSVSGYASGIIITAAIVFLSFGIITSVLCLMIDGASIAFNMDMRPLRAGRCQYYSGGNGYLYENYYTTVSCWSLEETCNITVRSGTCYCCDLYGCAIGGYLNNYYEFVGVHSCHDVFTLYFLIWSLTGLNLMAFFMGILTTAVLGSIKYKLYRLQSDYIFPPFSPQSKIMKMKRFAFLPYNNCKFPPSKDISGNCIIHIHYVLNIKRN
uniref:Uncharacterized protein n=1 Tax=Periophthalmus magnuspinnatus TaxID=409849 RepID=A0A3B4A734_9GOBI